MKALFLIFHGFDPANGISKKIHYQVHALEANACETHLCYLTDINHVKRRMVDDQVIAEYGKGIKGKLYKRLEFNSIIKYIIDNGIQFVYIRSDHNANPFTIRMLQKIKKSGARIVMEIPTFPYDQEYISPFMKLQLFVDRCFRTKMAKFLDKIITFSNYSTIFGTDTLQISNGIDFSEIPLKVNQNDTNNSLHLIGVAEIHYWHGYDRLVKGLAEYYRQPQNYKVYFHIVGEISGPRENTEIFSVINAHQLQPYIIFHGAQHGQALTNIFEKCDVGIGSLGRHRSGIYNIKTLKNREYAARGIPFIYSETDEDFDTMPYIMKITPDESPVNIQQVIKFYQQQQQSPIEIRNSIQHLSWNIQMRKVIDAIS